MHVELGRAALQMERGAGWEWGRAVVEEAGWQPAGQGARTDLTSKNSLKSYREAIADAEGIDPDDLPSTETLRQRALAYFYTRDYRDEIAVSTGYEAAVAMMTDQWSGTIDELMTEARNDAGRITVDGIRAVRDKSPATIKRPTDIVDHAQHSADELRKTTRLALERQTLTAEEISQLAEVMRQVIRLAEFLLARLTGDPTIDAELEAIINAASNS
jgi:hypothetical protein